MQYQALPSSMTPRGLNLNSTTLNGIYGSSSLQASIVLDQPGNVAFTNLDTISGRIVVRAAKPADVSSIVVKLEGESRTRLMSVPENVGEKPRPLVEYHKILYRVQTVWPPSEVAERSVGGKASYTLPQGQHEYPFAFKIPFNNTCSTDQHMPKMVGLEARPATRHVKKTLPPTLSGFPGEAEIRYFVKVTVNRSSMFKENPRAYTPFNFFPIEPPRPAHSASEIYARQRHKFDSFGDAGIKEKGKGIFGRKSSVPTSPSSPNGQVPAISVDARLPEPAILTCNSDIPLRLILKKQSDFSDPIYLQSLQISLIGHTKVRAHEVYRVESNSWIIVSKSNMGVPINFPSDAAEAESTIEDIWRGQLLPKTVAPSFATCNIERSYQLDVRIGLSYAGSSAKPQNVVLPLRLNTLVYSGIAPPPELLARMAEAKANPGRKASTAINEKLSMENRHDSDFGANQVPPTPIEAEGSMAPHLPARPGMTEEAEYMDAPPSYEDAIAMDAPPPAAERPEYAPPPAGEDKLLHQDEKRGWVG